MKIKKNILITGASSGIGEATAELLAAEGHSLVLVARRLDRLEKLKHKLISQHKTSVSVHALDVSNRESVTKFGDEQRETLSAIDVLINNAGLAKGVSEIQSGVIDDWELMIDTNIKGLLYMTRLCLPHMTQNKSGHIVHIGSIAGRVGYPRGNVYCATKSAVKILSEAMRVDLSGLGIRVTEVAPGMANTEFSLVRTGNQEKADAIYNGLTPLSAKDIAESIAFCLNRPPHVNISELVIYPTDQASPFVVHRKP